MKTLFLLVLALSSANALAAAKTLVCEAPNGNVINWTAAYGEFVVTDRAGEEIANIDGLALGETKYYETVPAKTITPVLYGDAAMDEVLAEVVVEGGRTSIRYKRLTYLCQ